MKLNQLKTVRGSTKARIRVGRGIGSGKGKTCGRGVKGQKSRTGVSIKGFEGGQQPITRRLPKRGFCNIFRVEFQVVNLSNLQALVEAKHVKSGETLNRELLESTGLIRDGRLPVKLLAKGVIKSALVIEADAASSAAIEAIEKAGGKVILPALAA